MTPYEIIVEKILPYIKALVAIELYSQGLSQNRIGKLLGVSQAMVNKYISKQREHYIAKLKSTGIDEHEILDIVKTLTAILRRRDVKESIIAVNSLIHRLLVEGKLCTLHMKLYPQIPKPCNICRVVNQRYNVDPHILNVKEAVKLLESDPYAYLLVPEVGLNIAECTYNAKSISDVVAVPGRIVKVMRGVRAVASPVYGASRHLASILLAANNIDKSIRACINVRCDEKFIKVMRKRRYSIIFSGPHKSPEGVERRIIELMLREGRVPKAIVDRGGMGLEPIIYIFGENAVNVVKDALSIVIEAFSTHP